MPRAQNIQCKKCEGIKSETEFDATGYIRKDGSISRKPICKPCRRAKLRERYSSDIEYRNHVIEMNKSRDSDSFRKLAREYYEKNKDKILAYQKVYRGTEKYREYTKQYHVKNRERRLAQKRAEYHRNSDGYKERADKWRKENPDKRKEICARYSRNNLHKGAANVAKRRFVKANATPDWSDMKSIQDIYIQAEKVSRETGIKHEVDHIVPLQNDKVCGLHVPDNLRVITRSENRAKRNKLDNDLV